MTFPYQMYLTKYKLTSSPVRIYDKKKGYLLPNECYTINICALVVDVWDSPKVSFMLIRNLIVKQFLCSVFMGISQMLILKPASPVTAAGLSLSGAHRWRPLLSCWLPSELRGPPWFPRQTLCPSRGAVCYFQAGEARRPPHCVC